MLMTLSRKQLQHLHLYFVELFEFVFQSLMMILIRCFDHGQLMKMLNLRFRENAPRRPPRIVLVGPPGSGRNTQSKALAQCFGLVHISARALLKNEIKRNPEVGKIIAQCMNTGETVPDNILNPLIEKRIK